MENKISEFLKKFFPNRALSDCQSGSFGYGPYADSFSLIETIKEWNRNLKNGTTTIPSRSLLKTVRKCIFNHNTNIANEVIDIKRQNSSILFDNKMLLLERKCMRDRDHLLKRLLFESETIDDKSYVNLVESYEETDDFDDMVYILKEMEKRNVNLEYCLRKLYHFYVEEDIDLAKTYLQKGVDEGIVSLIFLFAEFEKREKNFASMKKYYQLVVSKGDFNSAINLGKFYYTSEKNKESMIENFKIAIEIDRKNAEREILRLTKNISELEQYCILTKCEIKIPRGVLDNINVVKFKNKCNFLSKDENCSICFENRKCIPTECCHYFCTECYPTIFLYGSLCPSCRCKL